MYFFFQISFVIICYYLHLNKQTNTICLLFDFIHFIFIITFSFVTHWILWFKRKIKKNYFLDILNFQLFLLQNKTQQQDLSFSLSPFFMCPNVCTLCNVFTVNPFLFLLYLFGLSNYEITRKKMHFKVSHCLFHCCVLIYQWSLNVISFNDHFLMFNFFF